MWRRDNSQLNWLNFWSNLFLRLRKSLATGLPELTVFISSLSLCNNWGQVTIVMVVIVHWGSYCLPYGLLWLGCKKGQNPTRHSYNKANSSLLVSSCLEHRSVFAERWQTLTKTFNDFCTLFLITCATVSSLLSPSTSIEYWLAAFTSTGCPDANSSTLNACSMPALCSGLPRLGCSFASCSSSLGGKTLPAAARPYMTAATKGIKSATKFVWWCSSSNAGIRCLHQTIYLPSTVSQTTWKY